ncbi:MAG: thiamine pyrophosphate-dependent enzyme [Chloroflexi bacterium]|nr:thiamine pyrophosphate-dependent enzyme [Chloroflexota bacterium]
MTTPTTPFDLSHIVTAEQVVDDYRTAFRSRQASLIGRREVLSGRAKFGIFGDGKEAAQIAMAHAFRHGDFRSGYYRDQTFMLALGEISIQSFFAQLYAHTDLEKEPATGGRLMNAHFATRSLNPDGSWRDLTTQYNSASDISPTAAQMPRLVGLAYASRLYREIEELHQFAQFSRNGDEVAFGTIGNASTAEGMFWEAVNAIGVLGAPAVISIWDDGYGISVPNKHQMVKENLSVLLSGFQREEGSNGYDIYTVKGWDYPALVEAYQKAADNARQHHIPAIIHVIEVTQPQGHSTSGSHERYKTAERLAWEVEYDCVAKMRHWMLREELIGPQELEEMEREDTEAVRKEQQAAWQDYVNFVDKDRQAAAKIIQTIEAASAHQTAIRTAREKLLRGRYPNRREIMETIFDVLMLTRHEKMDGREQLIAWRNERRQAYVQEYSSDLWSESAESPAHVQEVKPIYPAKAEEVTGFAVLNNYFETMFGRDPRIIAFGEDVGYLGDVNQAMAGLQAKYGHLRVSDTGIRETTIMGQAIGMAMRGLRPIAEIQYLDYILYALQIMSDDLATMRWRTRGGQKAPVIIRTRGHRLEGVWHSGSPMSSIIHMLRGIHVLVPRDMTRAVGFYNTLLQGDDPGLIVEVLNGYRKKERLPENLADITIPLGVPEVLREGADVTLITYGAMCQLAMDAAEDLHAVGIEVEVIDVQSLLPFDIHHRIGQSLAKTNRLVCVDEDVPGGATAYMLQQVLEVQGGYRHLDAEPRTLNALEHRPAYGSDGNYFSKPNREEIFEAVYELMHECDPQSFPIFYGERPSQRRVFW